MGASSKRRRHTIQRRMKAKTAAPPTSVETPAERPIVVTPAGRHLQQTGAPSPTPSRRKGGGCPACGVGSFASTAEALEHAQSPEHRSRTRATMVAEGASFGKAEHLNRTVPALPRRGPKLQEGKPWELFNSDGTLNLASYSFMAVIGFVELAHRLVSERVADIQGETGEAPEMRLGEVQELATALLHAADVAQSMARMDGRVDRMDTSHSRARGAIRTALRVYPVPWHAEDAVREEWLNNLANHAAALLRIALDLFRVHETGEVL